MFIYCATVPLCDFTFTREPVVPESEPLVTEALVLAVVRALADLIAASVAVAALTH